MKRALLILAAAALACAQTPDRRSAFTVSGVGLPASLGVPTPDQASISLSRSVTVQTIALSNTSGSAQTVTIQDCQATPFKLMNAVSMAANTTLVLTLNGIRFSGCIKWTASATSVMGAIVGQ